MQVSQRTCLQFRVISVDSFRMQKYLLIPGRRYVLMTLRVAVSRRDLLDEAKDYHLMPERRVKLKTFKTRPRCCSEVVGLIYAVGGLTSSGL